MLVVWILSEIQFRPMQGQVSGNRAIFTYNPCLHEQEERGICRLITEHGMGKDRHSAVRAILILNRLLGCGREKKTSFKKAFCKLMRRLM